jgi:hypothetical protein
MVCNAAQHDVYPTQAVVVLTAWLGKVRRSEGEGREWREEWAQRHMVREWQQRQAGRVGSTLAGVRQQGRKEGKAGGVGRRQLAVRGERSEITAKAEEMKKEKEGEKGAKREVESA